MIDVIDREWRRVIFVLALLGVAVGCIATLLDFGVGAVYASLALFVTPAFVWDLRRQRRSRTADIGFACQVGLRRAPDIGFACQANCSFLAFAFGDRTRGEASDASCRISV